MSVHYKFKSALEYDTVTFDGLHISVGDLKAAIVQQKRLGKTPDFDLQVTNAQTKEVYLDGKTLIPKNTSLLIARIPLSEQPKKSWESNTSNATPLIRKDLPAGKSIADLSQMEGSEVDKIKAMITQSTLDYDPSNYQKVRGANQRGDVPPHYRCHRCHQTGHWIMNCPISSTDGVDIKRSTGIPRSFMVPVEGPDAPGALMTPTGAFAVPTVDHEAYQAPDEHGAGGPGAMGGTGDRPPVPARDIPDDLICSLCRDLLMDAVMIPCCGNSFCDECIRSALLESEDHECPDCREKDIAPTTLIPNRFLRNSVASFRNQTGYAPTPRQSRIVNNNVVHQRPMAHLGHNGGTPPSNPQESSATSSVQQITVTVPPPQLISVTMTGGRTGDESDASGDDNITVTVPPAHRAPPSLHGGPHAMMRHPHYQGVRDLRPPGLETPPSHILGRGDEQRAPTPTVDERRDMHGSQRSHPQHPPLHQMPGDYRPNIPYARMQVPYNVPYGGAPPRPIYGPTNLAPPHVAPPGTLVRPPLMQLTTPVYEPLPPGIKETLPTNKVTTDPMEAFERMIREKEELARKRERRRRFSRSRSGSSRSRSPRSRSRSPVLRSPIRRTRSPSPRPMRSPRALRSPPRLVRSPRPIRSPRSRSRSHTRTPFSRSRSRSPRYGGPARVARRPPPTASLRHHRRTFSKSRSRSLSPVRLSPPPRRSPIPANVASIGPPLGPSVHRRREHLRTPPHYSNVGNSRSQDGVVSPLRRGLPPPTQQVLPPPHQGGHPMQQPHMPIAPYNARYVQRGMLPVAGGQGLVGPPGSTPNYPPLLSLKTQHDVGYRNQRYEDPHYAKQPPVPGFEPPPNRPNPYRDPLPMQPGQHIPSHQLQHPQQMQNAQHPIPVQQFRDNYRGDRNQFRDRGFRDGPYHDGGPGPYRQSNYRDGMDYRDADSGYRDSLNPYNDGPPSSFRDGPMQGPQNNDFEGQIRNNPRNGGGHRDRPYDRGGRDNRGDHRDKFNNRDHRDQDRFRDGERRVKDHDRREDKSRDDRPRDERPREDKPRDERHDYERNRDRDHDSRDTRDKDRDKYSPDKKRRTSGSPSRRNRSREGRDRSKDDRDKLNKRTSEAPENRKDVRKEHQDKDKFDEEKTKQDKKVKDRKKKKKDKDLDKKKKKEKKEKKEKEATDNDDNEEQVKKVIVKTEQEESFKPIKQEIVGREHINVPPLVQDNSKLPSDLYSGIDTKINLNPMKNTELEESKETVNAQDSIADEKESSFDGIELQAHAEELDIKLDDDVKEKTKSEMLAPLPELSKWEMDDEQGSDKREPGEIVSPLPDKSGKVTSEVLKRAENAIFAKAISAIRPIEIKKISMERVKLYAGDASGELKNDQQNIDNLQITIPSSNIEYRSIEINDPIKSKIEKTPPPKLSVKERLGSKVEDISRRRDERVLLSTVERIKSRSKTPKHAERRITVDSRDKSRRLITKMGSHYEDQRNTDKRGEKFSKRVRENELDKVRENQVQYSLEKSNHKGKRSDIREVSKKKDKDNKKHKKEEKRLKKMDEDELKKSTEGKIEIPKDVKGTTNDGKKSTLDEANFEPDYDETLESEGEVRDEKLKRRDRSLTPIGGQQSTDNSKRAKVTDEDDVNTIKLDLTNVKKRAPSVSASSSGSETTSSSSSSASEKKRKRRKKKTKKRKHRKHSSDSGSDSDNSSSDEPKKKKKKIKHKKKTSKKKKKSKRR